MNWFAWSLLSAVFAAGAAIFAKLGVQGVNASLATALRTVVVLLFTWAMAIPAWREPGLASLGRRTWLFLAGSGVATGLSWVCYFRALQMGKASQVAPVDKLSVPLTILLAVAFLGERLTAREICGASLIVVGALLMASR